jgi:hypothetical protein
MNVPCPRPSPGELPGSEARSTCASTRSPKSVRSAWTPESTNAMVGALSPPPGLRGCRVGQSWSTPTAPGQSSVELRQVACADVGSRPVDDRQARRRVGEVVEGVLRPTGAVVAHYDHGHVAIGSAPRDLSQRRREIAPSRRVLVARAGRERRAEREQQEHQNRPLLRAPAAAVTSPRGAPEPTGARLAAAIAYVTVPQPPFPFLPIEACTEPIRKPIPDPSP